MISRYFLLLLFTLTVFVIGLGSSCSKKNRPSDTPTNEEKVLKPENGTIFNLKELGALGTISQIASNYLQSALDNMQAGDVLFIPSGTYIIDRPIEIRKAGLTIRGEGESTILRFNNKTDFYKKYKKRVGILNILADNIHISKIQIDQNFRGSGREDGQKPLIGSLLIGGVYKGKGIRTKNLVIENCLFNDYYGDAVSVFLTSATNVKVLNNHFVSSFIVGNWKSAGTIGEQAISFTRGKKLLIEGNIIEGALDDAIALHRHISDAIIRNNTITSCGGRILMNGTENGLIENNKIEYIEDGSTAILISFDQRAKHLSMNNGIVVQNNEVIVRPNVTIKYGFRLLGPGENITVKNNTIRADSEQNTGIELSARKHNNSKAIFFGNNIAIEDNQIINFRNGIEQKDARINKAQKEPTRDLAEQRGASSKSKDSIKPKIIIRNNKVSSKTIKPNNN